MKKSDKNLFFYIFGLLISTLPPLFAVFSYFPIWQREDVYTRISALALCLILICALPLFRYVKRFFASPSAPLVWLFVFIIFFCLSKIADEVTVISFTGFISNLIGAVFFKLSRRREDAMDEK